MHCCLSYLKATFGVKTEIVKYLEMEVVERSLGIQAGQKAQQHVNILGLFPTSGCLRTSFLNISTSCTFTLTLVPAE